MPGYAKHAIHDVLCSKDSGVLTTIPVTVLFDEPAFNLSVRYEQWSESVAGGPLCIGDGAVARKREITGDRQVRCVNPGLCPFSCRGPVCVPSVKLMVCIDFPGVEPGLIFELRSSAFNTYASIRGQLDGLAAMHDGLRHLPLELSLWLKSTAGSGYEPFVCAKIGLRSGFSSEMLEARRKELVGKSEKIEAWGKRMLDVFSAEHIIPGAAVETVAVSSESAVAAPVATVRQMVLRKTVNAAENDSLSLFSTLTGAAQATTPRGEQDIKRG